MTCNHKQEDDAAEMTTTPIKQHVDANADNRDDAGPTTSVIPTLPIKQDVVDEQDDYDSYFYCCRCIRI